MRLAPTRSTLLRTTAIAAGLLVVTGCNGSFSGKATIPSDSGRGVAAMDFKILCDPATQVVSGYLNYLDPGSRVAVRAVATGQGNGTLYIGPNPITGEFLEGPAECDNDVEQGHYVGSYTGTVNGSRTPGSMSFDVEMDSEQCDGDPFVEITLDNSRRHYDNAGCLINGSITPIILPDPNPGPSGGPILGR